MSLCMLDLGDLSHWHPDDSIRYLFIPDRWRAGTTFRHIRIKYNIPEKSFKITNINCNFSQTVPNFPEVLQVVGFLPFLGWERNRGPTKSHHSPADVRMQLLIGKLPKSYWPHGRHASGVKHENHVRGEYHQQRTWHQQNVLEMVLLYHNNIT